MKPPHVCCLASVWCVCMAVALEADTLVLKDGRRVEGQLIAVRDGVVEFERRRPQGGRERFMVDRVEVRRIEFDEEESDRNPDRDRATVPSRPSGLRQRDVNVEATIAWNDTGVDVRSGQTIYFSATGRVRWGPGSRSGPEGEHNSASRGARPLPGQRRGALIGRVGDSNDYFLVGDDQGPIRLGSSGRLYLGVNDDSLHDNAGSFQVAIFY